MPDIFILAQIDARVGDKTKDKISEIITEITSTKIVQGLIILAISYLVIYGSERLNQWLSERVPSRFRLIVRQSLPIWRAAIVLSTVVLLMKLFLRLSPNNILAITGTVAVALGFAFKDYISSVIAGLIALFEVPYRVGDRIHISGYYGEIVNYGLRGIRLRTLDDNVVTIPHNKIWTDSVANANDGSLEAQVVTNFYFPHDVAVELVMKILYQAAYTSKYTQPKLPIIVTLEETPWCSHFKLKCYPMDARDEIKYQTDLVVRSKQTFAKYGISYPVAFADRDSEMGPGNANKSRQINSQS